MIEISKPEGALKHKGCDSCGDHENVIVIRISSNEGTCTNTVCLCRDCAKLISIGLDKACEILFRGPEGNALATRLAKGIMKDELAKLEEEFHAE
ncbi:hypothetical protein [uncultured Dialister sp.]|uniref:hypothetical protein n=1 Tax=uncultured Dialister sp. TaxID=278064 RepID=UPI00204CC9AA|nr:hypothetical protein [uncultured Dialister sp.]DAE67659.1 MAG TPA: hypothetical protein [Caudoviricetes sp.]